MAGHPFQAEMTLGAGLSATIIEDHLIFRKSRTHGRLTTTTEGSSGQLRFQDRPDAFDIIAVDLIGMTYASPSLTNCIFNRGADSPVRVLPDPGFS